MTSRQAYAVAAAFNAATIAAFAAVAARQLGSSPLTLPNLFTLTRAACAIPLAGTAASARGRSASFLALLAGCSILDWVDGPLARRLGPSRLGALLDIEADSWLTLWGALAGIRLRTLPLFSIAPPLLRYSMRAGVCGKQRTWQRAAGVAQMLIFLAGLAERKPRAWLVAGVAVAQSAALLA